MIKMKTESRKTYRILAVDDDDFIVKLIIRILSLKGGFELATAKNGHDALRKFNSSIDLVLLDINLPDMNGLTVLRDMRKMNQSIPVVMMTGDGRIETAVSALRGGAIDYIGKPFESRELISRIKDILKTREMPSDDDYGIIGSSPRLRETIGLVEKFSMSDITILLQGETGVGKELFASAVHKKSKRRDGPFVPLDCATLSDNLFESELFGHEKGAFTGAIEKKIGKIERAHGGTLFIDEVQNLSTSNQAKLLRVIQEREIERVGGNKRIKVDVRIVAAANLDLKDAVNKGDFRADLYYRLSQIAIEVPPIRERGDDIKKLVQYFLAGYSREFGKEGHISSEAMKMLNAHDWPGNVRELENVIKSAAILSDGNIEPEHLPSYLTVCRLSSHLNNDDSFDSSPWRKIEEEVENGMKEGSLDLKPLVKKCSDYLEETVILKVMNELNLNMNMTAQFLNVDPKTLRSKIKNIKASKKKDVKSRMTLPQKGGDSSFMHM